jgi:hypothetical protein
MNSRTRSGAPSARELLAEVKSRPASKTYAFEDYLEVVHELKTKGESYADIAAFLAKRLGIEIKRGQVYRAYQLWLGEGAGKAQPAAESRVRKAPDRPAPEEELTPRSEARAVDQLVSILDEKFSRGLPHRALLRRALGVIEEREARERTAQEGDLAVEMK